MFCTSCGNQNEDNAKFCSKCGAVLDGNQSLTGGASTPPAPPSSSQNFNPSANNVNQGYNSYVNQGGPTYNSGSNYAGGSYQNGNYSNNGGYNNNNMNYYNPVPASPYAGFWKRVAASMIDGGILGSVSYVVNSIVINPMINSMAEEMAANPQLNGTYSNEADPAAVMELMMDNGGADIIGILVVMSLVYGIVNWLYYAILESSSMQATVGKMALGIKVVDLNGNRISFMKATGRYFGKIISSLICSIGYLMAGFTEKKQALHDMMAGCLVVNKR